MALPTLSMRAPPSFLRWWHTKGPRERGIVAALAALVGAAVLWLAVWQPLQRDLAALRVATVSEHRMLASGQRMANEIASLARTAAVPGPPDLRAALDRVMSARGLRGAITQIDWQEGRARLVLATVPFDVLISTLETLQRETGLRVVEATMTALVNPGTVRAELVLAR